MAAKVRAGDRAAARRLTIAHLRTVFAIAREYRHLYPNLLELIQEGNLALIRAIRRYRPEGQQTLGGYAASWIRTYILRFVVANTAPPIAGEPTDSRGRLIKRLRQSLRSLEAQIDDADGDAGDPVPELDDPALTLLALTGDDAADGERPGAMESSAEAGPESLSPWLAAPDVLYEIRQEHRRLRRALPAFERGLSPRERAVFKARVLAERPQTLAEKAAELGLTAERVRQIEAAVIEKLRAFLALGEAPQSGAPPLPSSAPSSGAPTRQQRPPGKLSSKGDVRIRRSSVPAGSPASAGRARKSRTAVGPRSPRTSASALSLSDSKID
ncbi:MAG TPA: sigma-70 family RNA polymerase sigma factor [Polyangia bacterium]|nr:sigma-70 family RNA polymerase sigma factor [Polyangia bacterium]